MAATGDLAIVLPAPVLALDGTYTGTTPTDTSNDADGILILGGGQLAWTSTPVEPPSRLVLAPLVDKAVAYPTPNIVDGRPE